MKNGSMNRFLSVIMGMIMVSGVAAAAGERVLADKDPATGILYTVTGNTAEVIGFMAPAAFDGALTIPSTLGGANVTSISQSALSWKDSLISVSIPNSVTSIGDSVFYGCANLASVSLSSSITSLGKYVFYECVSLTGISIPDGVVSLGDDLFYGCTSLSSVRIPGSVTNIGIGSFFNCSKLSVDTFLGKVAAVGNTAFDNGNSTQIIFVVPIGSKAYYDSLITAKVLGTSTAVIVEIPAVPTNLTASSTGPDSTSISWTAVDGASGYAVYRSKLVTIARSTPFAYTVSTSFSDTGLTTGTMYYYKIAAYKTIGTTNIFGSATAAAGVQPLATPTPTPSAAPKPSPTPTPNPTPKPTPTPNATLTSSVTAAAAWTPTPTLTPTPESTFVPVTSPSSAQATTQAISSNLTGIGTVTSAPKQAAGTIPEYLPVLFVLTAVSGLALLAGGVFVMRRRKKMSGTHK